LKKQKTKNVSTKSQHNGQLSIPLQLVLLRLSKSAPKPRFLAMSNSIKTAV